MVIVIDNNIHGDVTVDGVDVYDENSIGRLTIGTDSVEQLKAAKVGFN